MREIIPADVSNKNYIRPSQIIYSSRLITARWPISEMIGGKSASAVSSLFRQLNKIHV